MKLIYHQSGHGGISAQCVLDTMPSTRVQGVPIEIRSMHQTIKTNRSTNNGRSASSADRPFKFTGVDLTGPFNPRLSDKNDMKVFCTLKKDSRWIERQRSHIFLHDNKSCSPQRKFFGTYGRFTSRRGFLVTILMSEFLNEQLPEHFVQKAWLWKVSWAEWSN